MTSSSKDHKKASIGVIGVGGGGGNAINNMIQADLAGVTFLAANTDAQALATTLASNSMQLGLSLTNGLGSGAQVAVGRAAAEESEEEIREWVSQYDLLFITAGLGGGTGTGAIPIIAKIAQEENTLSIAVVTLPFNFEGSRRMSAATEGLAELEKLVNTLIIIPNQNLFAVANATTTLADAFALADEVLLDAIRGITNLITLPGMINLDFADVKAVITKTGRAMMGTGVASGSNRALDAAEAAIANPLLETASIKGARGLLISITGGADMTLFEIDEAANRIRNEVDNDCLVIFGSAFDPTLEGSLRVSIVATGLCERSRLNKDQQESETNIKSKLNFALEPKPQPELEPELDLERTSKASKQPIDPVMEPETETIIEPASNKASDKTQTNLTNKPIPTPTVPRPENPRPVGTPTPHATHQNTMNKQPEEKHSETVLHDEPKVAEKKKPKLSWTKKIFGSD
tara:strand:+ start:1797 stop:3182 length:1386 start_codon:yes stop_codon:yes gene_type:complete